MEEEESRKILSCGLNQVELNKVRYGQLVMKEVISTFAQYSAYSMFICGKMLENYGFIDPKYLTKLSFNYKDKVQKVKDGILLNQFFFTKLVNKYSNSFDQRLLSDNSLSYYKTYEMPYVRNTFLKNLVVEWGDEGDDERNKTYGVVLEELKNFINYEDKTVMDKDIKILVPGCRFSRLIFELAKLGFNKIEGNESSLFYITASDYIFNYAKEKEFQIVPRIHSFCSSYTEESVIRKHLIPNVDIKKELGNINVKEGDLFINKGEFLDCYRNRKEEFDAVLTIFSIEDTKNIMEYIETVYNILKKGGVWINLGGLGFYKSDEGEGIALPYDVFKKVLVNFGFEIRKDETPFVPYMHIKGSSNPHIIGSIFFSAVKK